jgi:MFS superfamily sulfate permease-like transporter
MRSKPSRWLFPSLAGYRSGWARGDLVAGLTVWAVLIPEALAYASIAGVSSVVGLYGAPGALILYAALGSSRHLLSLAVVLGLRRVAPAARPAPSGRARRRAA